MTDKPNTERRRENAFAVWFKSKVFISMNFSHRALIERLARWYLSLAPASPPEYWRETKAFERAQMEYDDEIAGGFLKWFSSLSIAGKDVLDLGCGYGGRTVRYAELGARSVTGIEPEERQCAEGREFAAIRQVAASFKSGIGERLPLPGDCFDCIVCYDVLEHVSDPEKTLEECLRVLRPGGSLFAVFPPFYHPTGAHFDGWLSKMPWPNVLFPCQALVKAGTRILTERGDSYRPNALRANDKLWALNGITIRKLRHMARRLDADFQIGLTPLFSPQNRKWESWRMKYFAPAFDILRKIPLLQECFTHRIVLTMTKPLAGFLESPPLRMTRRKG
jgi:SAM-dependent methyltransferase